MHSLGILAAQSDVCKGFYPEQSRHNGDKTLTPPFFLSLPVSPHGCSSFMLRNYFSLIPLNIAAIVCFGVPLGLEKVKHIHLLLGDCASGHCSGGDAEGSSGSCVPSKGKLGLAGYACVDAALCESGKCVNDSCQGELVTSLLVSTARINHITLCSPKQRKHPMRQWYL